MGSSQSIPSTKEINKEATTSRCGEQEERTSESSTKNGQKNLNNIETIGVLAMEEPTLISTDEEDDEDHDVMTDSSDDEYDTDDDDEEEDDGLLERRMILEEARKLRMIAEYYYHPEKPVKVDGTACARSYFSRYSAPEQTSLEEEEERQLAMADADALRKLAVDYLEPERPVEVTDPTVCARNYFSRSSAPQVEDGSDDVDEFELIMDDMKQMKTVAEWYLQPEKPVAVDFTACGRNYFTRASAPEYEEEEDMDERDRVLAEAAELKKVSNWYLHPEKPVVCDDPCATGRNYYARPSAPQYEDGDEIEERNLILSEAMELKKVADWYLHPEKPIICDDARATGRNYFSRPSAPEYIDEDTMDEEDQVLADAAELKKIAGWYRRPEQPVSTDANAFGRNYFDRFSAESEDEDSEERQRIIAEAKKLKEVAEWYHCPNKPVVTDGFASGRNFFTRPSAPDVDDDTEEREAILADAKNLKKFAEWYHCPEKAVEVDPTTSARNYFDRPSAPEVDDEDSMQERGLVLAEAQKLKEVAGWYHHPETPVDSSIAVTRNYFTRSSADATSEEDEEEKARILADALQLKKLASDYMHPEKPVVSNVNCVRNYFDRASAPGHADHIHTHGHANEPHVFDLQHHDHHIEAHYDYYHHHDYHYHQNDDDHSHHTQSDHFEMDEDVFHNFRDSMVAAQEHMAPIIKEAEGDEKEGNLSRSPSSVMLFEEAAM